MKILNLHGFMGEYVWFASYMKKKVTIVAPSAEVKEDLLLLLMRIEGCEQEWFNIVNADELDKKWLISAVPTAHVKPLEGRYCSHCHYFFQYTYEVLLWS
ncbi:MAG TPA: hypothetical protein P5092_02620 [Ruminococcus sp.]|nr:hypothetical protein [Ruminococcus sp.]